jgi:Tfp pilus assembly protein PilF
VAVAALLFGLHPVHVESVAWVSERKDVLSGFFFLLALISYIRYASTTRKTLYYSAALIFSFAAMMSKPITVTLPFVLLILDYYPLKRLSSLRTIALEKIPFALFALFTAVMTLSAQTTVSAFTSGRLERALVSVRADVFYLQKTVLPVDFAPFYPIASRPGFSPEYLIALFILSGLIAFCVIKRKNRVYTAALAFYLLTLLPVIGIIQISSHLAADRYMYLPGIALFMLAGIGAARLAALLDQRRKIVFISFIALFAFLAFVSVRQINVWKDSNTLWSHEIEKYPYVYLAYNNRAVALTRNGSYAKAIEDLEKTISLAPDFVPAYMNLADIYKKVDRKDIAVKVYDSGLEANRGHAELLFERGLTYNSMGKFATAAEDFTAVLSHGFHIESLIYRAAALIRLGDPRRAADDLRAALAADPQNALAHHGMAEVYYKMKDSDLASYHINRAKALGYH